MKNTKQRTPEREFRQLWSVYNQSPIPTIIINTQGKLIEYNDAMAELTGYSRDELPDAETWLNRLYPDEEYRLTISFGCDPQRSEELIQSVLDELAVFKAETVDSSYIDKVKETHRRQRETSLKQNSFWLSNLNFYYFHNENPNEILMLDKYIDNLTAEDVQEAARKYFDMNNYVTVILYPEDGQ